METTRGSAWAPLATFPSERGVGRRLSGMHGRVAAAWAHLFPAPWRRGRLVE